MLKQVLVHGRMFIGEQFLCFYSNLFGMKTTEIVPYSTITAIEKSTHALINPGIEIVCQNDKRLYFYSFVSRESALATLQHVWKKELSELEEGDDADEPPFTSPEGLNVHEIGNQEYNMTAVQFFEMFWADSSSMCLDYRTARQDFDLKIGQWQDHATFGKIRELEYRVFTNAPIGPRTAKVNETQRYSWDKDKTVLFVESICHMTEVPYCDCFCIETKFSLSPIEGAPQRTKLLLTTGVRFLKSCWIQDTIESNTNKKSKESYAQWIQMSVEMAENGGKLKAAAAESQPGPSASSATPATTPAPISQPQSSKASSALQACGLLLGFLVVIAVLAALWTMVQKLENLETELRQIRTARPEHDGEF
eukprot:TRINITY_DN2339_c0_g2_i6.p1 TRINITY_DN2339_c0_g2~~TRINITY_DN2339_c0_g2_i6.p1  ORF type:complete len:365 (-),score=68.45 TRINITY_DN2339_c0_g2_i6:43-1137(-)